MTSIYNSQLHVARPGLEALTWQGVGLGFNQHTRKVFYTNEQDSAFSGQNVLFSYDLDDQSTTSWVIGSGTQALATQHRITKRANDLGEMFYSRGRAGIFRIGSDGEPETTPIYVPDNADSYTVGLDMRSDGLIVFAHADPSAGAFGATDLRIIDRTGALVASPSTPAGAATNASFIGNPLVVNPDTDEFYCTIFLGSDWGGIWDSDGNLTDTTTVNMRVVARYADDWYGTTQQDNPTLTYNSDVNADTYAVPIRKLAKELPDLWMDAGSSSDYCFYPPSSDQFLYLRDWVEDDVDGAWTIAVNRAGPGGIRLWEKVPPATLGAPMAVWFGLEFIETDPPTASTAAGLTDFSDPANPTTAGTMHALDSSDNALGSVEEWTIVGASVVDPEHVVLIRFDNPNYMIEVWDVSDPMAWVATSYLQQAGNSPLNAAEVFEYPDGSKVLFLIVSSRIYLYDISDPSTIVLLSDFRPTYFDGFWQQRFELAPERHYAVRGKYLAVSVRNGSDIVGFDISSPTNVIQVTEPTEVVNDNEIQDIQFMNDDQLVCSVGQNHQTGPRLPVDGLIVVDFHSLAVVSSLLASDNPVLAGVVPIAVVDDYRVVTATGRRVNQGGEIDGSLGDLGNLGCSTFAVHFRDLDPDYVTAPVVSNIHSETDNKLIANEIDIAGVLNGEHIVCLAGVNWELAYGDVIGNQDSSVDQEGWVLGLTELPSNTVRQIGGYWHPYFWHFGFEGFRFIRDPLSWRGGWHIGGASWAPWS